jgi:diguanylate cyclase (GGDEF)-like protein/PAS domain S-box-containing protein
MDTSSAHGAADPPRRVPDRLFQALVDATAHPFLVLEPDGTIVYAGRSITDLLGWQPAQLVGANMVDFLPDGEIERAALAFEQVRMVDRRASSIPMVFQILRSDGTPTWCEVGALSADSIGFDGLALRLRSWTHNHHFNLFLGALSGSAPFADVCEHLCRSIAITLQVTGALIHHGFDGYEFRWTDGAGVPRACAPADSGPWHRAALTATPVNATLGDLPPRARIPAEEAGLAGVWCVPIHVSDHLPPAVLSVWRADTSPPLLGHQMGLDLQARYVQLAIQKWIEHQRLVHIAGHDGLTGVANRANFRERLAEAIAIGEADLAVAFCDLDAFKPVNDVHGHHVGDQVLVQVADRLRSSLRAGDDLARIGGDEFTVLMRNVPDADAARHLAERMLAATAEPFVVDGRELRIGLSIGIALITPDLSADTLLALADGALYQAKREGGGRAHVAER